MDHLLSPTTLSYTTHNQLAIAFQYIAAGVQQQGTLDGQYIYYFLEYALGGMVAGKCKRINEFQSPLNCTDFLRRVNTKGQHFSN